ncbi:ParB/RepB/Spo0J family partition protein [Pontiella agarivorans]|uniref:ParB/RepB/Spo0J family partition protein n=1 Tax=Pontiella agarivorans TaxID=3038953 RepID=A0ABU5MZE6_9BACT|nr:ParB/RepB/Spo0J family partition protein [Pontiella agarivorans]MDZ8119552.1 ParB/RepB/Spo0J family partition protein [Pontiella agarivorans]
MAGKKAALGRGLDVLIKDGTTAKRKAVAKKAPVKAAPTKTAEGEASGVREVPVSKVVASPWQPRSVFEADALTELVESIKVHGVLQPLLVREVGTKFELIAGERRLRASQAAMLKRVPVIVIEASDEKALEIALIENLQREDLNPIEEAEGYALLQKKFNMTQDQVARQVGKARASVANALRLLELPDSIRKYVAEGLLSVGHAKVLLSLETEKDQAILARKAIKDGLSVRALEKLVKKLTMPPKKPRAEKSDLPADYLQTLTDELHQYLGTSIRISPSKTLANGKKVRGSLEIDYHDNDELDRLLTVIGYASDL